MNFYTNVTRYGNNLLYIGYKGGQRVKQRISDKIIHKKHLRVLVKVVMQL